MDFNINNQNFHYKSKSFLLPEKKLKSPYFSKPNDDKKEIQELNEANTPTFEAEKSAKST